MATFKVDFATMSRIKKMNQKQLGSWLVQFGKTLYNDGYTQALNDIKEEEDKKEDEFEKIIFEEDEFYNMLISIKGISMNTANKIMDKIMSYSKND